MRHHAARVSPHHAPSPPVPSAAPPGAASGAPHFLHETARRLLRQPAGWVALVLRLSAMTPPAPRPHHRRIARALLQDAAQRHEGQVFVMPNGDLVLLHRPLAGAVATLAETLGRLLRIDAPDPAPLLLIWSLAEEAEALMSYAENRAREPATPAEASLAAADLPAQTGAVDAIAALVEGLDVIDLLQRQTAIAFGAAGPTDASRPAAGLPPIVPLFREITFSIAGLEARISATPGGNAPGTRVPGTGTPGASADPFLFRHLASRLDRRMLELLPDQLGTFGPLDMSAADAAGGSDGPPLHLNLTLASIESAAFQALIAAGRARGARLGVEVSLLEACAQPDAFARARTILAAAQCRLVLDNVSHMAMTLTRPWLLGAALIKLEWSPRMADLPDQDAARLIAAIALSGPHAILLCRAETEAALRWGVARGIRQFQGRHVDAMLGAARIMACPAADGCTLRQCIERAAATAPGGRRFCRNTPLLDAGAPRLARALTADHPRPRVSR